MRPCLNQHLRLSFNLHTRTTHMQPLHIHRNTHTKMIFIILIFIYSSVSVCLGMSIYLERPELSDALVQSSRQLQATQCECWEPNSGSLTEQHMLFIAESALQPHRGKFTTANCQDIFAYSHLGCKKHIFPPNELGIFLEHSGQTLPIDGLCDLLIAILKNSFILLCFSLPGREMRRVGAAASWLLSGSVDQQS